MRLRTLVLDLDGTLVDSVPDLAAALNRLMAARGLARFSRAEVTGFVGDGVAALVARAFVARSQRQDAAALAEFSADYAANAARETVPFPGVRETLERLAEAGWGLAVCTNKPEAPARSLLAALRLEGLFAAIGGGDSFPMRKPDPAHLLATLQAAGGVPGRAVMVGDHHNDVLAAAGAGIPSIFAAWGYGPASAGGDATAVAASFAEVPVLAERLLGVVESTLPCARRGPGEVHRDVAQEAQMKAQPHR
jgi:phosphoglycolate phosphatase